MFPTQVVFSDSVEQTAQGCLAAATGSTAARSSRSTAARGGSGRAAVVRGSRAATSRSTASRSGGSTALRSRSTAGRSRIAAVVVAVTATTRLLAATRIRAARGLFAAGITATAALLEPAVLAATARLLAAAGRSCGSAARGRGRSTAAGSWSTAAAVRFAAALAVTEPTGVHISRADTTKQHRGREGHPLHYRHLQNRVYGTGDRETPLPSGKRSGPRTLGKGSLTNRLAMWEAHRRFRHSRFPFPTGFGGNSTCPLPPGRVVRDMPTTPCAARCCIP